VISEDEVDDVARQGSPEFDCGARLHTSFIPKAAPSGHSAGPDVMI
jgi:hypothetical protein